MRLFTIAFVIFAFTCGYSIAGEIHNAARTGDLAKIKQLLDDGGDVNEASSFGSALHFAVIGNQVKAARLLVDNGAYLNAASTALGTPLHAAARNGNVTLTEFLIEAGAAVDARDSNEFTPLHFAALKGSTQIVQTLIAAGADAKALAYGPGTGLFETGLFEPLQLSEKHGHAEVSDLLRAAGGGARPVKRAGDLIAAGDPKRGRELAYARCGKCHVIETGDPTTGNTFGGPSIIGIYGKAVAVTDGFDYSPALEGFGGEWTEDRLYAWILHPMLTVPGVLMPEVKGFSPGDVADVVAYLKAAAE